MSELIDRQALEDAVKRYAGEPIKEKDRKCQAICLDMLGTIDAQTTIDAVPVVRCKDCKWFGGKYNDYCFRDEYNHAGDWFCADGERREG